jgi:hypothetical protein
MPGSERLFERRVQHGEAHRQERLDRVTVPGRPRGGARRNWAASPHWRSDTPQLTEVPVDARQPREVCACGPGPIEQIHQTPARLRQLAMPQRPFRMSDASEQPRPHLGTDAVSVAAYRERRDSLVNKVY